ncbi:MAG TPA: response regulator, partial [Terriglobales bacterium]
MHLPKAKILVVDDEPGVLTTVQAVLQREGYDVDAAGDGASALAAIGHTHYDLVLTDLKMPDVDGLAVLAEVRKRSPQTVTVIMTGFGSVGSALEAVQLGAYEYLLKPTEVSELKQAVERSLERKRLSEIDTLYRAGWTITRSLHPNLIATEVSEAVRRVLGVASACLVNLVSLHQPGNGSESLRSVFEDPGLLEALRRGAMVTQHDNFSSLTSWLNENGVASVALVPGIAHERLVCVLCADNGAEPYEFHASAQRFLDALAGQTALALENDSLISELRQNNTELAAANRKLQELDKLKSQFLSVATHELRTPLSVILGYNSMLAETLEGKIDDEEKETLRESIAACKRLIRLVNSML